VLCQFSGPSCGHHGPYTFYRSFAYRQAAELDGSAWKTLSLGQFFIVRISARSPAAVAELQLIWETSNGLPGQKLASVKIYFLPEHTPASRQPCHGQVTVLQSVYRKSPPLPVSSQQLERQSTGVVCMTRQLLAATGTSTHFVTGPVVDWSSNYLRKVSCHAVKRSESSSLFSKV